MSSAGPVLTTLAASLLVAAALLAAEEPAAPFVGSLSDKTIAELQKLALEKVADKKAGKYAEFAFLGVTDRSTSRSSGNITDRLHVISARVRIAFGTVLAAKEKGTFTPTALMRQDLVDVSCGGSSRPRDTFDCAEVSVLTPDGNELKPVSHDSGPHTYHNAFGASWSALEVKASFPAARLTHGFTVKYASPSGIAWTFVVSELQVQEQLLLNVGDPPAETSVPQP